MIATLRPPRRARIRASPGCRSAAATDPDRWAGSQRHALMRGLVVGPETTACSPRMRGRRGSTIVGSPHPRSDRPTMHLRPINVNDGERTLRMAIGWVVGFVGFVLVGARGSAAGSGAVLAAAGWTLFLTGFLGRCPVYRRLGRSSPRRADIEPAPARTTPRPIAASGPRGARRARARPVLTGRGHHRRLSGRPRFQAPGVRCPTHAAPVLKNRKQRDSRESPSNRSQPGAVVRLWGPYPHGGAVRTARRRRR